MATIIDGKKVAQDIATSLIKEINQLSGCPHLTILLVGNDPASEVYVRNKVRTGEKLGMKVTLERFDEHISEEALIQEIQKRNEDTGVHGILVQAPLPSHISFQNICSAIHPQKDVDGFGAQNVFSLYQGSSTGLIAATPQGVISLLKAYNVELEGKRVVIIGKSTIVGKPQALLCLNEGATITLCHSRTTDLNQHTLNADIIISAVGKEKLITADMVREDAICIDVGINRGADGKLCGDMDYESLIEHLTTGMITPVPGGVGPMTIITMLQNLLKAYNLQKKGGG